MNLRHFTIIILMLPILVFSQSWGLVTEDQSSEAEKDAPLQLSRPVQSDVIVENIVNPDEYLVGPGDDFLVSIETTDNLVFEPRVSPTGNILIPGVGIVVVRNLNLTQAKQAIEALCRNTFNIAEVHVALLNPRKFRVHVSGAVLHPGLIIVNALMRLSDVLEVAELSPLAREFDIQIKDGRGLRTIDITEYYISGNLDSNPPITQGAQIHVPFGDIASEGVMVRGAILEQGFDIIRPDESLGDYIKRRIIFAYQYDIEAVKVIRVLNGQLKTLTLVPVEFQEFQLVAGDQIEFLAVKPVSVIGYVGNPGSFNFIPGYTAGDYVARAGGISSAGTSSKLRVIRTDGEILYGEDVLIQRGDIIEVKRSLVHIVFGEISVMDFLSTVGSLMLAYLATSR